MASGRTAHLASLSQQPACPQHSAAVACTLLLPQVEAGNNGMVTRAKGWAGGAHWKYRAVPQVGLGTRLVKKEMGSFVAGAALSPSALAAAGQVQTEAGPVGSQQACGVSSCCFIILLILHRRQPRAASRRVARRAAPSLRSAPPGECSSSYSCGNGCLWKLYSCSRAGRTAYTSSRAHALLRWRRSPYLLAVLHACSQPSKPIPLCPPALPCSRKNDPLDFVALMEAQVRR